MNAPKQPEPDATSYLALAWFTGVLAAVTAACALIFGVFGSSPHQSVVPQALFGSRPIQYLPLLSLLLLLPIPAFIAVHREHPQRAAIIGAAAASATMPLAAIAAGPFSADTGAITIIPASLWVIWIGLVAWSLWNYAPRQR